MTSAVSGSTTMTGMLREAVQRTPHKTFLRTADGDLTFAETETKAASIAAALRALGVGHGSTVAVMMSNCLDQVALWFAIARIGAIHAPLNSALTGQRLRHALTVSDAELIVVDDDLLPASASVIASHGQLCHIADLLRPRDPAPVAEVDELALATLLFTSGTTGVSKACALSHRYLVRQAQIHARQFDLCDADVLYTPFPLFHIDATTLTTLAALSVGATAALGRRFSASRFWSEVRAFRATVFNFMGATLTILWKQPPSEDDRRHEVRLAWGVPLPAWKSDWERRFGFPLFQVYGLTDGGVPIYDDPRGEQRTGACGRVIDEYEVQIVDEVGAPLPPGRIGEVEIRGREAGIVMNGYHAMPDATAEVFRRGWLRTGDLGRFDEEGFFYFEGRTSDSIRRRGENISAFEVEEIALGHDDVVEVAAIGVPSDLTEEDVKIVVVKRPGATLTPAELHAYFRRMAPGFMVPRYIEFADQLPRTPTEKVEKFKLKARGNGPDTWDAAR